MVRLPGCLAPKGEQAAAIGEIDGVAG